MTEAKDGSSLAVNRNLLGLPAVDKKSLVDRLVFSAEKPIPVPGSGKIVATTLPKRNFGLRKSGDGKAEFLVGFNSVFFLSLLI